MLCLARLTNWEKTNSPIGSSNKRGSLLKLCPHPARKGDDLCEECATNRPREGKYQSRMLHGLLTEPFPEDSHIYGSPWYWERVAKYGDPFDTVWLEAAAAAQAAAEERCRAAGKVPWKVQRPGEKVLEEMKQKKKTRPVAPAAAGAAAAPQATKGTLYQTFAPIKVTYTESDKKPEKLSTDSMKIWKESLGDSFVWVSEDGFIFDCDTTGEPGELLGKRVKGEFISL